MTIAETEGKVSLPRTRARKALLRVEDTAPEEILAYCPGCKTLEVIRFSREGLIATRKFTQKADKVYHACGSGMACHLHGPVGRTGAGTAGKANVAFALGSSSESIWHSRDGTGVAR